MTKHNFNYTYFFITFSNLHNYVVMGIERTINKMLIKFIISFGILIKTYVLGNTVHRITTWVKQIVINDHTGNYLVDSRFLKM